jgi:hypothetical protein
VTRNLSFLCVGPNPRATKFEKAKKQQTTTGTLEQFKHFLETGAALAYPPKIKWDTQAWGPAAATRTSQRHLSVVLLRDLVPVVHKLFTMHNLQGF